MYIVFSQSIILHEKCAKIIYNILNENVVVPTSVTKWKTELTAYNAEDTLYYFLKICFNQRFFCTQASIWNFAQKLYATYKINIKTTNRCGFCKNKIEITIYVFISCEKIHTLWMNLFNIFTERPQKRVEFNIILFMTVINFIILYMN